MYPPETVGLWCTNWMRGRAQPFMDELCGNTKCKFMYNKSDVIIMYSRSNDPLSPALHSHSTFPSCVSAYSVKSSEPTW